MRTSSGLNFYIEMSGNSRVQETGQGVAGSNSGSRLLAKSFVNYAIAVILVSVALRLTRQLPSIYESTPNSLFFCAVLLAAWRGGPGPAVIASILSTTAIIFFLPRPAGPFDDASAVISRFAVFLFAGAFMSWLTAKQKRIEGELRLSRDHVEESVKSRRSEVTTANDALRKSEAKLKEAHRIAKIGYWQRELEPSRTSPSADERRAP
jgi:K+-sensing histidine kinase KdpD